MHSTDDPANLSSLNGPGSYLLDGCSSTRNRKVEGSNPSSGSRTAGQRVFVVLLLRGRDRRSFLWLDLRATAPPANSAVDRGRHDYSAAPPFHISLRISPNARG